MLQQIIVFKNIFRILEKPLAGVFTNSWMLLYLCMPIVYNDHQLPIKQKEEEQKKRAQKEKEQKESKKKEEEKKEMVVRGLPRGGVLIASAVGFGAKEFSAKELETAIKLGAALEKTPVRPLGSNKRRFSWPQIWVFLSNWQSVGFYPHHFGNFEGNFVFRNQGAGTGKMREMVLVWSPRGTPLSHRIDIRENPERVIYQLLTHAGLDRPGAFRQAQEKHWRATCRCSNFLVKLDVKRSKCLVMCVRTHIDPLPLENKRWVHCWQVG